jgi:hypothetical protein
VGGVLVFHAVHVFDPLDFYVKSDAEWDAPAAVQLVALILGSAAATLALYELLRRVPGAGLLLGQRKRSSARARIRAVAPGPSSAVT